MKLFFLLLFLAHSGKDPSDDGISYRTLSWADYKGQVPETELLVAARTVTQLEFETTEEAGKFTYAVKTHFLPYSSFVRERSKEILRHEQTHFQIAYIVSLRCLRDLVPLQNGDSVARNEAQEIFNHYVDEKQTLNDQFDAETKHGLNDVPEKEWELRISKQLKSLTNGRRNKNSKIRRPLHSQEKH